MYKTEWKVYQDAVYWINLKKRSGKGSAFWQNRSNAVILHDSVPADSLEKVVNTKTGEILYQKASLSPRPVQREDYHQRGTSTGRPVADEGKMELQIDSRIQGISHAAVEQEQDSRTRLI